MTTPTRMQSFAFPTEGTGESTAINASALHWAKRRGVDALIFDYTSLMAAGKSLVEHVEIMHPQPGLGAFLPSTAERNQLDRPFDTAHLQWLVRELSDVRYARAFRRPILFIEDPHTLAQAQQSLGQLRQHLTASGVAPVIILGIISGPWPIDRTWGCDFLLAKESLFAFDIEAPADELRKRVASKLRTDAENADEIYLISSGWTPSSPEHLDAFLTGILEAAETWVPANGDAHVNEHINRSAPYPGV